MASVRLRKRKNGSRKILHAVIEAMEVRVLFSTYVVNTFVDRIDPASSRTVSLRDALALAAAHSGADTVDVPAGAYKLTLDELFINDTSGKLSIQSTGGIAKIDAQGTSRVLEVAAGSDVSASGLTVTGGTGTTSVIGGTSDGGGGIMNEGSLSIANVTVTANSATAGLGSVGGGGISNEGTLIVNDSTISGNTAHANMFSAGGSGGGIETTGNATVTDSVVSNNSAVVTGGGVDAENTGTLSLLNVLISDNQCSNDGGGLYSNVPSTVSHCTIEGNSAFLGAGCSFDSQSATLIVTTVANNTGAEGSACADGGNGTHFINCTIVNNTGTEDAGLDGGGIVTLANTILAGNTPTDIAVSPNALTSLGHNLIGQDSPGDAWIASDKVGSSQAPLDPLLAPVGNYGGPTPTIVPLAGSPALAGGSVALIAPGDTTDQRGLPRVVNGAVDIGADEVQGGPVIHLTAPAPQSFAAGATDHVQLGTCTAPAGSGHFFVNISWGDGTPDTTFTPSTVGTLGAVNHHFAIGGAKNVRISITDSAGDPSDNLLLPVTVKSAPAITIVVNTTNDQTDSAASKTVSLRDAITRANGHLGPVSITFDPIVFAHQRTITLDGSSLELSDMFGLVRITGTAAGLTIDGHGLSKDFVIDRGVTANFSSLRITGGYANSDDSGDNPGNGGGIDNAGALTLFSCNLSMNSADDAGGGIYNVGAITLISDTFSDNGTNGGDGGGIYNAGSLSVQSCKFINNDGGDFTQTYEPSNGGGIANVGVLTVSQTLFTGNRAFIRGSGISNTGSASINRCTFSENGGSVIYNAGAAVVNHCTLTDNSGDVIDNPGRATIVDSTLSGNRDIAINNYGTATVAECTITNNTSEAAAGGIYNADLAQVTISNTIVAGNTNTGERAITPMLAQDVQGLFDSLGHNLIGKTDGSSGWIKSDLTGTNAKPLDPELSPLGDHGGSVQTQVPLGGSPAIGRGSTPLIPSGITTDVRGFARVVNGALDIGAVELQRSAVVTVAPPAKQSVVAEVAQVIPLGSFVDPRGKGPFQVDVNWGDGSADSAFTIAAPGSLGSLQHGFINTGALIGGITVTDAAGNISNLADFSISSAVAPLKTLVVNFAVNRVGPAGGKILTLQDAVAQADSSFGPVNIEFDPTVFNAGAMVSLYDSLNLTGNRFGLIRIDGPAAGVTIDAAGFGVEFDDAGYAATPGVFVVDSGISVALSNVTLQHCMVTAISNAGNLTLTQCTVTHNQSLNVGGIFNSGTMTVVDSTVSDNEALMEWIGKGAAGGFCGGIDNAGVMTLLDSTVSGNSAVNDSTVSNSGTLTVTNCTIADNFTGGSIYGGQFGGDGIDNHAALVLNDDTIAGNAGIGVLRDMGSITIADTIIAGNLGSDVSGAFKSKGHNLIGEIDGSTGWINSDLTGTAAHPRNARLSPLGAHGGPTPTIVPLSGSPALAAGAVTLIPSGITTDQRGLPRVVGGHVDIGAVETQ